MAYGDFFYGVRLEGLSDTEWRVWWRIILLIDSESNDGRVRFTWNRLSGLLGLRNKNITLFRMLKKFHDEKKLVWENYQEFAERIPGELRDRLGIGPEVGVRDRGVIPKSRLTKGGVIWDKVTLFSPQVVEMHKARWRRFGRKRKTFEPGFEPCPYHDECQFLRTVGEQDYCSDGSLAIHRLREALRSEDP